MLDLGYQIIAISADKPSMLKVGTEFEKLKYTILSDNDLIASRALGLAYQVDDKIFEMLINYGMNIEERSGKDHHLLPVPAAYVVSTDGVIKFEYINPDHKVRINADVLYAAAKAALEE